MENKDSIAYLGEKYSYHFLAAEKYFGKENNFISCNSFEKILQLVKENSVQFGIIAIDNTLAGEVKNNLERVLESNLQIEAEIYYQINLHLAAKNNIPIDKVRLVYSHPMALKEASQFLNKHPSIKLLEKESTAGGIKYIAENGTVDEAAIGNKEAINHFGLTVIAENIDNNANNFTRFFILTNKKNPTLKTTFQNPKSSLLLQFAEGDDKQFDILNNQNLNIPFSKQVLLMNESWHYVEIEFENDREIDNLKIILTDKCKAFRVLGIYEKGRKL